MFPFESAALTKPVAQVKAKGAYVTVVDRGLTDTSAQDASVSGDNTAFGKIPAEYLAKAMNGKGNLVALWRIDRRTLVPRPRSGRANSSPKDTKCSACWKPWND